MCKHPRALVTHASTWNTAPKACICVCVQHKSHTQAHETQHLKPVFVIIHPQVQVDAHTRSGLNTWQHMLVHSEPSMCEWACRYTRSHQYRPPNAGAHKALDMLPTHAYTWSPQYAQTHAGTFSALDKGQQMQKHDQQLTQADTYKSPQHMHKHADMTHASTCEYMRSSWYMTTHEYANLAMKLSVRQ
jgi:hypothetical protein